MSHLSFELGTEIEQKPNVLTWRLPKQRATHNEPVPEQKSIENSRPVFGRRTVPPVRE